MGKIHYCESDQAFSTYPVFSCRPADGDFCAGPSHVLPTAGSGRFFRGLSVEGFYRRSSLVRYSEAALRREVGIVETFASLEGLAAHGRAGSIRVRKAGENSEKGGVQQ